MNKLILFAFVAVLFAAQACSKKPRKTSEPVDEGGFANDPTTLIRSKDKKFLCDFQWTDGYENWAYDFDGNKPIGKLSSAKDPWCLIPYGEAAEYEISIQESTEENDVKMHYFCRELNSNYNIANESEIIIEYGEQDRVMKCAELNSGAILVTSGNVNKQFQDEMLYHVVNMEDRYSIAGHLNLRLVKPVYLNVLWEPIWNSRLISGFMTANLNISKIKEDWKRYMKKAGYYIEIKTIPIVFPNLMEDVNDGALTLPQEKDVLEYPARMIDWYNTSAGIVNGIGEFFGADIDLPTLREVNYTIATTPGYKVRYPSEKLFFNATGANTGISSLIMSEQKCDSVSYAIGENNGARPQAFSIKKGYVLSDVDFFKSKNTGRLLAALLYSKVLKREYPIENNDNGRWLSSYKDENEVEQPSKDWKTREEGSGGQQQDMQQELLEFTWFMNGSNIFYITLQ